MSCEWPEWIIQQTPETGHVYGFVYVTWIDGFQVRIRTRYEGPDAGRIGRLWKMIGGADEPDNGPFEILLEKYDRGWICLQTIPIEPPTIERKDELVDEFMTRLPEYLVSSVL